MVNQGEIELKREVSLEVALSVSRENFKGRFEAYPVISKTGGVVRAR